jgi:hypothetical protein
VLVLDVLAVFFPPMNLFLPPPPPPILLFGKVLNDFFSNFFFLSSFIHSRDSNSSQPSNYQIHTIHVVNHLILVYQQPLAIYL